MGIVYLSLALRIRRLDVTAYTISDRGVRRSFFLGNKGYGGVSLEPLYSLQLQPNTYNNFKAASIAFL